MIVRTAVKTIQDIMRQDVGVDGDAQRTAVTRRRLLNALLAEGLAPAEDRELESAE
jgi:hypothetical protein